MQSNRSRPQLRYRRQDSDEDEEQQQQQQQRPDGDEDQSGGAEDEDAGAIEAPAPAAAAGAAAATAEQDGGDSWLSRVQSSLRDACASALSRAGEQPALAAGAAGGVAVVALAALLLATRRRGGGGGAGRRRRGKAAAAAPTADGASSRAAGGGGGKKAKKGAAAAAPPPGPNAKLKPTANCVPLADGSAVVVRRPIAADNSCLFNAVGYCMHRSTSRAPFLRQVVSREVSSDPETYSDAFLGMTNAAYCQWIVNPAHWGGGIELAILAAHYRREIAAWNLVGGDCHVFGEDAGHAKQVMVVYSGTHYDALAVAASPRADQEDDATEFNPRTRRGRMILAAAQQLVRLHRKGRASLKEIGRAKEALLARAASGSGGSSKPPEGEEEDGAGGGAAEAGGAGVAAESSRSSTANGPAPRWRHAGGGSGHHSGGGGGGDGKAATAAGAGAVGASAAARLACTSCGVALSNVDEARSHAAQTGHTEFAEVEGSGGAAA